MASRPTRPPPPPPPPPTRTTSQPHGGQFTTRDHSSSAPLRRPSNNTARLPGRGILSNYPVDADSSSDDDDVIIPAPASKRPSQHSRSMSHPFPSLFSSKKKKVAGNLDRSRNEDLLGSDDDHRRQPQSNPRAQTVTPRKDSRGPMDFNTGNCMTCSSLVRWPKGILVFRCTICLTINDLKPLPPDPPHNGARQAATEARHLFDSASSPSRPDGKARTSPLPP